MTSLLTVWACACAAVAAMPVESLPVGSAPKAIECDYFPSRLHAFVWRNWECANLDRMAQVAGATAEQVAEIGASMGLPPHEQVNNDQLARGYISVIRRNWHLLPYDQLLVLLGWDADKLAYTLREDDVLWIKLGSLKPACLPIEYAPPDTPARQRCAEIKAIVEKYCGAAMHTPAEPRFGFVREFSQAKTPDSQDSTGRQAASGTGAPGTGAPGTGAPGSGAPGSQNPALKSKEIAVDRDAGESIRFLYSYFALFGDPLIDDSLNPYPDGLLERLRGVGVNGVWLHVVLRQLAPAKDFPEWGEGWQTRLANLRKLVDHAGRYGVKVYLYTNEPRAMPNAFFTADRAGLRGVQEGDYTGLCTSTPAVREWVTNSLRHVFTEVPNLGGVFTITGSENLTNCWSHHGGEKCPRCSQRTPEAVIAELNKAIADGVHAGNPNARVLVWDWGWKNEWCDGIINALPKDVLLMSVSEWDLPIARGGVNTTVTEYSLSGVGPGPRAKHNWEVARKAGIKTMAKIQANITWELSAVPYLPVMDLVAQHCEGLNACGVDGMMLSWSLGGYPSPNLELVNLFSRRPAPTAREALTQLARQRYGDAAVDDALAAWSKFSKAFAEFPYHQAFIYRGPMQWGPANPLYLQPTGYHATMVGFPYDDIDGWRVVYPAEVLADQLEKVASGWRGGLDAFGKVVHSTQGSSHARNARKDARIARAAWIHLASAANQSRFILARRAAAAASQPAQREPHVQTMRRITETELTLAQEMFALTREDSRIGYEASNHYYYYPFDLAEKIVNCDWVLRRLSR